MGISLVRIVGPGVSLSALGADRCSIRQSATRPERWHQLDGNVLPELDANCDRARNGESCLRKYRDQVLRTFFIDRRSDEQTLRQRDRTLGRRRRILL